MPFTVSQIAAQLQGEVLGDGAVVLTGFAPADHAKPGDLTFAENEEYLARAEQSAASAVLVPAGFTSSKKTLIRVANPRVAFAKALPIFFPLEKLPPGIHPSAVVAASAQIDPSAHIGPLCVVGERVRIGARSVLRGGNHVGNDTQLGDDCCLYPNVVVYHGCQLGHRVSVHAGTVIGSDGFGYVLDEGRHRKVLQLGNVIIHDDVEIGANTTVDRGALGSTVIGRGSKIDNLVMVAHNVVIGENSIAVAQVGIAGSTKVGSYCVLAGQAGLAGHLKIGNQVTVAAQSGVMRDIGDGQKVLGSPAMPDKEAKRQYVAMMQLPELIKRVRELERQVADLHGASGKVA
ncbi:MAG: UDP-3-O-(3-hydroxymyristoyl)glucosamine N-acyltransferase [Verrucomicrobia bacterium]|nr:UDP-3-O-(3-hydroxymyristoyl)glucosamine N-acyltransferase [Verrucomicrobiota bacterium]